jgi:hypothetical protein
LSAVPPEDAPVFTVTPAQVLLGPREGVTVTITGLAVKPGKLVESLTCVAQPAGGASGGSSSKAARCLFDVKASADVAAPMLKWSETKVNFSYVWAPGCEPAVLTQALEMQ